MAVTESPDAPSIERRSSNAVVGAPTLDVHAHAMPLPLLERLAARGLADVSAVPQGIVRLDPRVSGVGPGAPLPLARSQYDVGVRLTEMDEVGRDDPRRVVATVPVLHHFRRRVLCHRHRR